ncbi:MAG: type II secretion system minor pseudopilin GspH [Marinobacter sp.]|uniref:type II secretion system minor pseudopilin GspH n=1 Tax=Marinobacter sp. TaxID=50741 RepID=UPI00299E5877|nr:type II secretion system minor pseudopilin GspH [Marinobacter sp.]MDX1634565.1 type II secretion system minor pseudopilin GspH [Marinobacter sp.]
MPRKPQTQRGRGFTMIEILVVLIVVGLLAALAVANLGGSAQQRELENTARELFLLMQTASEQAVLNNQELGMVLEDDSYRFLVYDELEREWVGQAERLFQPRQLPETLVVTPIIETNLPTLAGREEGLRPDLVFFSSGEVTPFELELSLSDTADARYRIQSDGFDGVTWLKPGEEPDGANP